MGKFIISEGRDSQYHFQMLGANGQVVLKSDSYSSKKECENGIQSVIENAALPENFKRKQNSSGAYYFILTGRNGKAIGKSELYASEVGRESGIFSVMQNSKSKKIEAMAV
jgi:uncharacterized protein